MQVKGQMGVPNNHPKKQPSQNDHVCSTKKVNDLGVQHLWVCLGLEPCSVACCSLEPNLQEVALVAWQGTS